MQMSRAIERIPTAQGHGHAPPAYRAQRGFSLIELVIGLVVVSLLLALGIPSFKSWVINSQIRDGAEAILNGIQVARGTAIQQNLLVVLTLTPQAGTTPASWSVDLDNGTANIQRWTAAEGAANTVMSAVGGNKLTFNGLGQRVTNSDSSAMLTQVDVSSSASSSADIRTLSVVVGAAGSAKMCDPHLTAGDPRAC